MANQLKNASSPYLLQHANNPVDWFPWGEEAFQKASSEDKPIFLSIGYSACHWCHVMEHESFESSAIADVLNEHFVSIKVDREERPDIDQIYMQVVQMMTGSGGWPMSIFMSPNKHPFYAGTYWPPEPRWGRPGFKQVLEAVANAWNTKREQIDAQGVQVVQQVARSLVEIGQTATEPQKEWIENAANWLLEHYDQVNGGFGGAPKFPHAIDLQLLIDLSAISPQREIEEAVLGTLEKMGCGGIYDHLGGGFARYSVDDRWLVPHFEKMLYDNALMSAAFADAYRLWRKPWCMRILRETLDYVIRDMTNEHGGFHSTEDADSEGHEGKFYVWSKDEIADVLDQADLKLFLDTYGVTEGGNFEGSNILNLQKPLEELYAPSTSAFQTLARCRERLFEVRARRVRPGLDDKVILSWNALMMIGMVKGYRATGEEKYLNAARNAYHFVRIHLMDQHGMLWHSWRNGSPTTEGYLDDYTFFIEAIAQLFEVEPKADYLRLGCKLAERVVEKFRDEAGGFYYTSDDAETLIARSKDLFDSSVPGSNATAASALWKLGHLTGRDDLTAAARSALFACSGVMSSAPQASAQALRALLLHIAPPTELVVIDPNSDKQLAKTAAFHFNPIACLIAIDGRAPTEDLSIVCPPVGGKVAVSEEPTLFVCESGSCSQPLVGEDAIRKLAPNPLG